MSEEQVNEGHPNEEELEESEEDATHGAEESDVSGAPQTGTEDEQIEEPNEDAAGE